MNYVGRSPRRPPYVRLDGQDCTLFAVSFYPCCTSGVIVLSYLCVRERLNDLKESTRCSWTVCKNGHQPRS